MVTMLLLAACGPPPPSVTTIHGVQVVAIQADPPQPAAYDTLNLDVWVADGIGLGTEVVVWLCTPYEDECLESGTQAYNLEAGPEEFKGVPLSLWSAVGFANPKMSLSRNFWPLLVSGAIDEIDLPEELEDGYLAVWALACVPGYCPFMEDIAISPLPGSDAWEELVYGLAHPAEWVAEVPDGYASLALKLVPLWRPGQPTEPDFTFESTSESDTPAGRNHAPRLTEASGFDPIFMEHGPPDESVDGPRVEGFPPLRVRLDQSDPDFEDLANLQTRAFVTSGLVTKYDDRLDNETVEVLWSPQVADADRTPQMFVVVDDARGGTGVWSSVPSASSNPCDRPPTLEFTTPGTPGGTVVARPAAPGPGVSVLVEGTVFGTDTHVVDIDVELRAQTTGQLLANGRIEGLGNFDSDTCTGTFQINAGRGGAAPDICDFGGAVVDVVTTVSENYMGFITTGATEAVLHLDSSLPCVEDN